MANEYDYEYKRARYGRDFYDEPYRRGYDEPHHRRPVRYYNEPYNPGYDAGSYYEDPYAGYDYGRYEFSERSREPYWRDLEGRIVRLTTGDRTVAALAGAAFLSAREMRSDPGSVTKKPNGAGIWTICVKGHTPDAALEATSALTNAFVKI